jgi:hypothetical protein
VVCGDVKVVEARQLLQGLQEVWRQGALRTLRHSNVQYLQGKANSSGVR